MRFLARTSALGCLSFLGLAAISTASLSAQEAPKFGPPNVLVIQREYLKPGKSGSTHEKSESAFVKAMAAAKTPSPYFALDSLSGASRSLFLISYGSFAEWEKDNMRQRADKTLSAAFDKAQLADGDLLSSYDSSVFMLRPDLGLNPRNIKGARYFDMSLYYVKAGHNHEWDELVKMYKDGMAKADPSVHWDVFELAYGSTPVPQTGSVFLVVTLMDSLAEVDKGFLNYKKFADALGSSGMKKLDELSAACVQNESTNLFEINPRMSYPEKAWIDADPTFWKPAPSPMPKKAAAPKPATP